MKSTKRSLIPWCAVTAVVILAVLVLPFFLQSVMPAVYADSYYAVLQDKVDVLKNTKGAKTVIIGGSGVAFSVDTDLLAEKLGQPCVNFGLYAAFGTVYMTELAKEYIGQGDTVILCPELSSQTCSMYFGADAAWQATEGRAELLLKARMSDRQNLLTSFPAYLKQKCSFLAKGENPSPSGVYARSSFDENGILCFDCAANLMEGGYQKGSEPTVSASVFSDDFIDYLNRTATLLEAKGATVYYALPFMNALSVAGTEAAQEEVLAFLNDALSFPLLCGFEGRILDPGYFYDSNYHTNNVGREAATLLLAQDILRSRGIVDVEINLPEPLTWDEGGGEVVTSADGLYSYYVTDGGAVLVSVSGDTKGTLTVPDTIDDYTVVGVAEGAFKNAEAESVVLGEGVAKLGGRLFEGCEKLKEIHLKRTASLPSVGDDLLNGFDGKLKIYVASSLYGDYATDYFWLYYADCLVAE